MEAKLPTHLLSQGWCYGRGFYSKHVNVRFWPSPSHGFFPTSCKMRNRNYSSQNKKQVKKIHPSRPTNVNSQEIGDEESDSKSLPNKSIPILKDAATDDVNPVAEVKKSNETNSLSLLSQSKSLAIGSEDSDSENLTNKSIPILKDTAVDDVDPVAEVEQSNENSSLSMLSESKSLEIGDEDSDAENLPKKSIPVFKDAAVDDVDPVPDVEQSNESSSLTLLSESRSLSIDTDRKGNLSNVNLQDLIGMIRNAETNIHLLNQARIRALEDLEKILDEKETLQGEINGLELKLAETDARLKVAAHEKIHVEVLEDQLEKLRTELSTRGGTERVIHDTHVIGVNSFSEELYLLRKENMTLKSDLQMLRGGLTEMKETNARVQILEKERSLLESSLRELEAKVADSQEDVSKLSTLRSECRILYERVDDLQKLLDEATKQANQAILVLQENHELRKKVEKLEDSLEEANVYKLSSEKMQHYNDLMQHKLKILDERLEKSDEEIYTYVQLYEDSVKDFRETLNKLKGEGKRKDLDEPANDMPWEFWSRLLLMIDAWLLEKKVLADDAYLLREMVWKRDARFCDAYQSCREKNEDEIISTFLRLISSPKSKALHIIHIAAEMAPVAKVGGLGDVVAGLGKELQKRGHLVEIVLPKYDCINYELIRDLRALDFEVESYFDGRLFRNKIWTGTVEGLPVYFIEPLHPDKFFWRGQYYGEHDDFKRFSFFSRAALELLLQAGKKPDIIHCHDWQTAFVAPLYWDIYAPKGLDSARICFTCHNFEYQGAASASDLASCGLDVNRLNRPDRMQHHSGPDRVNSVKGAIVFSNIVTTVSPTYAQEVRTAEGGKGLHSTLKSHSKKFVGILNGIDPDAWNPATDNLLKVQYDVLDTAGKAENKEALRRYLNLSSAKVKQPMVGCITRLVPQKGVHLIRHALYRTVELGGQFVLLGSSPVPHIQREFENIAKQFQNHEHAQLILKYDESLAHLIYAASDMFIIPSIFEPCGLTQMIAMRYGSIPIARKTGGLNDSVFDLDDDTIPEQFRNGFIFVRADEQGVSNALERAFYHYRNNNEGWQKFIQKVMGLDFSWKTSAAMYEELYLKTLSRTRSANLS